MDLRLKYGCNPNQTPARVAFPDGTPPIKIRNGQPGYINLLDALNGWQLVRELKGSLNLPAAASFKHVSPAGAAIGLPLSDTLRAAYFLEENFSPSPLCCAYIRARGADRLSAFGDFIALSDVCDVSTALYITKEVSDGIIAPGYDEDALSILQTKKKGAYTILEVDPAYSPSNLETRDVFGMTFTQARNTECIHAGLLNNIVTRNKSFSDEDKQNLLLAMITLKYTQSNSVCYAADGQAIGIGAGQQSRIHCTRLAGNKSDLWHLRQHPRVLSLPFLPTVKRPERDNAIDLYLNDEEYAVLLADGNWPKFFLKKPTPFMKKEKRAFLTAQKGVCLASDAFFPFEDNIERAARSGVTAITQPGGSMRDAEVIAACDRLGIAMVFTGLRLFTH